MTMMMTISSSSSSVCCCLNNNNKNNFIVPSTQPQFHPSSSKSANRIPAHCWQRNKKADALQDHRRGSAPTWWSSHHCVLGIASMVIILMNGSSSSSSEFMRVNLPANYSISFNHHHVAILSEPTAAGAPISSRWSDTRACPPWRLNSLETIVPENLPRPSTHRRSESVTATTTRTDTDDRQAGAVLVKAANPNCFSM